MDSSTFAVSSAWSSVRSSVVVQLLPLDEGDRIRVPLERLAEPFVVERVSLLLQPLDRDTGRKHDTIPRTGQPLHRDQQLFAGTPDHLGEQDRALGGLRQMRKI